MMSLNKSELIELVEIEMSEYAQQKNETTRHYDQMRKEIESIDLNMLYSVVPGSRLQEFINLELINNTGTEGLDEE